MHMFTISEGTTTLVTAFTSALDTIKSDVMTYIGVGLPVGLAIMGTVLAITIAVKAFKRFAK